MTYHIYSVCYYDAKPFKGSARVQSARQDVSYSDTAIRSPNRYLKKRALGRGATARAREIKRIPEWNSGQQSPPQKEGLGVGPTVGSGADKRDF